MAQERACAASCIARKELVLQEGYNKAQERACTASCTARRGLVLQEGYGKAQERACTARRVWQGTGEGLHCKLQGAKSLFLMHSVFDWQIVTCCASAASPECV
eukprot:scaffold121403_cov18-Tisochrysis_lutea.AAC.3